MKKNIKNIRLVTLLLISLLIPASTFAHSALCSCFDNGDGSITCEGGFSDGSTATGVRMFIRQMDNKTLIRGKINNDGEFSFDKPSVDYKVVFDAGPGHQVIVPGTEIVE